MLGYNWPAFSRCDQGIRLMSENFYPFEYAFDKEAMLKEARSLMSGAYKFKFKTTTGTFIFAEGYYPLPKLATHSTPELEKAWKSFKKDIDYGDMNLVYFKIDEGELYDWHRDNVVDAHADRLIDGSMMKGNATKDTTHVFKEQMCAVNILLSGQSAPVEFKNEGPYLYENALLNTMELHRVQAEGERIMAKFVFRDKTFNEIKEYHG